MKKWISLCIVAAALLSLPSLWAAQHITVKGSDTIIILAQRWAEKYMQMNKDVTIQVTGGGSGVGIAALINGTTTLANASRPIKAKEIKDAKANGIEPVEHRVALDALAIVVNRQNPVSELSMDQVGAIYTGKISNWKEVGGSDQRIMRYSRESSSGTYVFLKEHVMNNKDYASDCQNMPGTSAVAEAVAKDPAGIGYGGVAYFAKRPELKILTINGVSPLNPDNTIDYEAVWNQKYPIARYLFVYSAGQPTGQVKAYLDWIKSREGQEIVKDIGYIPISK